MEDRRAWDYLFSPPTAATYKRVTPLSLPIGVPHWYIIESVFWRHWLSGREGTSYNRGSQILKRCMRLAGMGCCCGEIHRD